MKTAVKRIAFDAISVSLGVLYKATTVIPKVYVS